MSRRRRIRIIMGTLPRLINVREQEIGEVIFSEPLSQESIEWEDEEITEANLTQEQVDCLNDAAREFPD